MRFTIMMKPEGRDVIEKWKGKGPYGSKIVKVVPGKGQIKGESEWHDMIAVAMKANPLVTWFLRRKLKGYASIITGHPGDELIFDDFMEEE